MKLAAISMIRDEADIVATFIRHLAALFDIVFLLDQRSSDGSGELMRDVCDGREGWSYFRLDFAGKHQEAMYNIFMARAFEQGADIVYFIDSDEFVAVASRAELEAHSSRLQDDAAIGVFRWRACVPERFDVWTFSASDSLWIAETAERTKKVAVSQAAFSRHPALRVTQGSHRAIDPAGGEVARRSIGHLFHLPIRSHQQFLQKVFVSAVANFAKNIRMVEEGVNKRRLLDLLAARDLTDLVLASIAAQFNRPPTIWLESMEDLEKIGFSRQRMDIPVADFALPDLPRPDLHKIIARCLREFEIEDARGREGAFEIDVQAIRFKPG